MDGNQCPQTWMKEFGRFFATTRAARQVSIKSGTDKFPLINHVLIHFYFTALPANVEEKRRERQSI